jgi:hypothetical protein
MKHRRAVCDQADGAPCCQRHQGRWSLPVQSQIGMIHLSDSVIARPSDVVLNRHEGQEQIRGRHSLGTHPQQREGSSDALLQMSRRHP